MYGRAYDRIHSWINQNRTWYLYRNMYRNIIINNISYTPHQITPLFTGQRLVFFLHWIFTRGFQGLIFQSLPQIDRIRIDPRIQPVLHRQMGLHPVHLGIAGQISQFLSPTFLNHSSVMNQPLLCLNITWPPSLMLFINFSYLKTHSFHSHYLIFFLSPWQNKVIPFVHNILSRSA